MDNNNLENQNAEVSSKKGKTTKQAKSTKVGLIIFIVVIVIAALLALFVVWHAFSNKTTIDENQNNLTSSVEVEKSEYWIANNSLQPFDLYFLQLENSKENKVYSPLSIKYALKMLEEGAEGEAKSQIASVIGEYKSKKYTNSEHLSLANAIFVRDTYGEIKESYINMLQEKYNAEVKKDSFETANSVNSWIKDKTLDLIGNLLDDDTVKSSDFFLINALAIDMDWNEKFLVRAGTGVGASYEHEAFSWHGAVDVVEKEFEGVNEKVSGMEIIASVNNYDIVKELGEEKIKDTVREELKKYLKENGETMRDYYKYDEYSDEKEKYASYTEEELIEDFLNDYIKEIDTNYGKVDDTTEFSFYTDNNVKAFAKDLKEYDGTTLQYIGIMPVNEDLDTYIKNVKCADINSIIGSLKELKSENFKEGVITKISGFIPKFNFEYELKLQEDLNKLGITKVFEQGNANLVNISDNKEMYISSAKHKANIEFTQDGIKASAATIGGGMGAGDGFNYDFEVPVEEIDLTFDKPYIFLIRDKETGEVWFTGSVYSPLLYSEDTTKM